MTPTNLPPSQPPSPKASVRQVLPRNSSIGRDPLEQAAAAHAAHHHDDHLYDDEFLHNEDVAHEHTDVNVRELLLYTAGLVVTCVVCAVIVYGLFNWFERLAAAND